MPATKPVKVVWRNTDGKTRTRSYDLIPQAKRFAASLKSEGLNSQIFVQGELFETTETGSAKAYDPRYEIPF